MSDLPNILPVPHKDVPADWVRIRTISIVAYRQAKDKTYVWVHNITEDNCFEVAATAAELDEALNRYSSLQPIAFRRASL